MSSTPSWTRNSFYSDPPYSPTTEATEFTEDVSDATEHWRHNVGQHHTNYASSPVDQSLQPNLLDYVGQQSACMSHEWHGGPILFQNTESCDSWTSGLQRETSSTQGPGLLDTHGVYPALYNASENNVPPFPAQLFESQGRELAARPPVPSNQYPASTSPNTINSGKIPIERLPISHGRQRAERSRVTCNECGTTCKRRWELARHKRNKHEEGHDLVCPKCQYMTTRKDKMGEHSRRMHSPTRAMNQRSMA